MNTREPTPAEKKALQDKFIEDINSGVFSASFIAAHGFNGIYNMSPDTFWCNWVDYFEIPKDVL